MQFRSSMLCILPALVLPLLVFAAMKGDPAKGKQVFSRRCSVCHGENGEGKEAIGKVFGVTIPQLASKEVQSLDSTALKKGIVEGKGKMKPVNLTDQEAEDVVAYIRSLKTK